MSWWTTAWARARLGASTRPLSTRWGADRGESVHRAYLRAFMEANAQDVRGRVLEFNDPGYTEQIGGARVTHSDVLHIDHTNPRATIVADLTRPHAVPPATFDCVICTHVLHIVEEPPIMIRELERLLRPGGVLLLAVPCISMIGPEFPELWRFTPRGVERLLAHAFAPESCRVEGFGNSLAAAAEIRGVVAHELTPSELWTRDTRFTVEVCARAIKAREA